MGEAIDIKLLLTIGAMIVSVVTSSVIVKQKLAAVIERLDALQKDYESRLRNLDQRTDKQENEIDLNAQKDSGFKFNTFSKPTRKTAS